MTRSLQISDQNKSEARELEGLVKITYGSVAISLFKRAGNSNLEKDLNCIPGYSFINFTKKINFEKRVQPANKSNREKNLVEFVTQRKEYGIIIYCG